MKFVEKYNSTMSSIKRKTGINVISFETGNINMSYTGTLTPAADMNAHGDVMDYGVRGTLTINSIFDDESTLPIQSYNATSGPWGNGPTPNGEYTASHFTRTNQSGMKNYKKKGWKVNISDKHSSWKNSIATTSGYE